MDLRVCARYLVLFVSLYTQQVAADVNLEEHCAGQIIITSADTLTVSNWTALGTRGGTCRVNVTASPSDWPDQENGNQLMFLIQTLKLPRVGGNCSAVRLDIRDAKPNETLITPTSGLCGDHLQSEQYVSPGRETTVVLTSIEARNMTSEDLKLRLLTVRFHLNPCDDNTEFSCDNDRCVEKGLQCNGDNDCGDDSDEKDGCIMSATVYIIIGVCTGGLAVAVVWAMCKLYRGKSGRTVWWGESRLIVGASSVNEDCAERRGLAGSKRQSGGYGAT